MDSSSYVTLSYMAALRRQMDAVASNVANMNTTGYKSEGALFTPNPTKTSAGGKIYYVQDFGMVRNLSEGALKATGSSLDLALDGAGYFRVQDEAGATRYTRDGSFKLNESGEVVTMNGHKVLDNGGQPVTIPQGTKDIVITTKGEVFADDVQLSQIEPVTFDDERMLEKMGNGLYDAKNQSEQPIVTPIRQGMLESSNVESIKEMTEMIEVSKAYQTAQKFVDMEFQRRKSALSKLAGTN